MFDIDGTLTMAKHALPGATDILDRFQEEGRPVMVLTNNSGKSEAAKAEELTETLQLKKPIKGEQMVLNYTPVKDKVKKLAEQGIVLVVGNEVRLADMLPLPFISKYVTAHEYVTIFPETYNFGNKPICPPDDPTLLRVK